jgi:uncharacterized protein
MSHEVTPVARTRDNEGMGKTLLEMTPAECDGAIAEMRASLRRQEDEAARALERRREEAWALARTTARTLRERFDATRVLLFGSLASGHFGHWSDVDILAFGIPESRRLAAMADLSIGRQRPGDLSMDVLAAEELEPAFVEAAEREAVLLDGD